MWLLETNFVPASNLRDFIQVSNILRESTSGRRQHFFLVGRGEGMGEAANSNISPLFPKYWILFWHPRDFTNIISALSSVFRTSPGPSFLLPEVLRSEVRWFTVKYSFKFDTLISLSKTIRYHDETYKIGNSWAWTSKRTQKIMLQSSEIRTMTAKTQRKFELSANRVKAIAKTNSEEKDKIREVLKRTASLELQNENGS